MAASYFGGIHSLGRYSIPLVNSFFFNVCIGLVLGVLSGLGIGGGSLLMLWLTMVQGTAPETARNINLMFFLPSAIIASLFQIRKGRLHIAAVWPAMVCGSISAALFTFWGRQWNPALVKKLFGALLILTGLRELSVMKHRK